jgi:Na+-driven multidrug efflux pump
MRVKKALKLAILAASSICLFGFVLTQFLTVYMIRIFNSDPELIQIATQGMRIFLCMMPFIGFQIVSANYFQSVGKAPKAMFLSLSRQVIFLIPLLLILPQFFGLKGVWLAGPIADFTASVLTAIFLFNEMRHLNDSHELANG